MEKIMINVLVVYKNGTPIEAVGIEDGYTDIQISKNITDYIANIPGNPKLGGGDEARVFVGIYGEYEIRIEEKEISLKKIIGS